MIKMTKGLPASGKTTWAKEFIKTNPSYKIICKDDLREMLHDYKFSKEREKFILKARNSMIELALGAGFDIIVADTNLAPKHETFLRELADEWETGFEVVSFLDVSLDECLRRDAGRPRPVGEKVILDMYYQFIHEDKYFEFNGKAKAVIFDIDGTLAIRGDRSPYDMTRVDEDKPKREIFDLLHKYLLDPVVHVFIFSGRTDDGFQDTVTWLIDNIKVDGVLGFDLKMRKEGDSRKDSIVKRELYEKFVKAKYQVLFVVDDRKQVVDMWRNELGLTCLQVADHRF